MASRYTRQEVSKALELGKIIFPVIYHPAEWTGVLAAPVRDVQILDLRSDSYTDNFQKLVDGLIEAGSVRSPSSDRPLHRQPTQISLSVILVLPGIISSTRRL